MLICPFYFLGISVAAINNNQDGEHELLMPTIVYFLCEKLTKEIIKLTMNPNCGSFDLVESHKILNIFNQPNSTTFNEKNKYYIQSYIIHKSSKIQCNL